MAIEDIFARVRERKGFARDVSGLQQFLLQQQQSQGAAQQLAAALSVPPDQRQGIPGINFPTAPQLPQAQSQQGGQLFGNLLLQQQQQQGALGLQAARPISPSQIITQKQLDRINLLESKARQGTITQPEKDELQRSLSRNRPLVEFGALPGQSRFLSPSERVEQAKQPLTRPLTPTETKGVDVAINSILGKPKSLLSGLFGIRPGAAIPQNVMEQLWEQAMLETGYDGRSKIAKKQIESQFDRRVRDLNKGKGVGVLANQYQWNRGKYNAKVGAGSPKGLGSIWGRLNPEEQETARGYINQKIEPKKIVDWFNTHGGGFQFPKQIQ
ncbi:hypothetical protein LCGC14_1232880 [marine sediment metagenome]|uniref:Uncharacterized protein n=1 Tax=marine sediment metagenome TaxID=412755 RepID=A0A0F9PCA9_9ZZZZ